ncbi:MAG: hypothetical protein GF334_01725 [Candidatus Altiarchaeales archaeon]|nr:hypothetical protein [Candidatus Altiarchaeales archaeon]
MEKSICFTLPLILLCACLNQPHMQTTSTSTTQDSLTGSFETWPKVNSIPRINNASVERFIEDFGVQPIPGMVFQAPQENTSYVDWPMQVINVSDSQIIFKYSPTPNTTIETVFGPSNILTNETHILIHLPAEAGQKVDTVRGPAEVLDVTDKAIFIHFPKEEAPAS